MPSGEVLLFVYGSLQRPEAQLDTFGRVVAGHTDVLAGHTVDPRIRAGGGHGTEPTLRATGSARDKVIGRTLRLSDDELDAADEFASGCVRIPITLASGRTAWVHIAD